ncbi:MAG: B12-binding domain-containing radical SAM protein [Candidatus Xenobia bacterium]
MRRIAWLEPARLPYGSGDLNIYSGVLFPRAGPKMAGLLKPLGYQVEVISGESSPIDVDEIARDFDIACISVISNTAPHGMILGRQLVERGMKVIMGGYQFAHNRATPETLQPTEEALGFVPYVARGEGFVTLPAWLEAMQGPGDVADIGGLSYRTEDGRMVHNPTSPRLSREQVRELPPADWSAVRDRQQMAVVSVHGMYGCPRECSWCAVWTRDGRNGRNTAASDVVDELQHSLQQGRFRHVFFSADNFPVIHKWAHEVCEEMVRRDMQVEWTCQAEVAAASRSSLVDVMQQAGCVRWCIGLESINNASLSDSHKKQTRETMEACITELHRRGIHVHGMFIVGLPHDTPDTVRDTLAWARRMRIETVQFLCLSDLPGSADYEAQQLWEKAFRPFTGAWEPLNWMFVNGHYARLGNETMSVRDVQCSQLEAMQSFYSLPRVVQQLVTWQGGTFARHRKQGKGLLASLAAVCDHNARAAFLRFRGYHNIRQWQQSRFNQLYLELLDAGAERGLALQQQIVNLLPPEWLAVLARVHRERRLAASQPWPESGASRPLPYASEQTWAQST